MSRRRLRVAVPPHVASLTEDSGHGKLWSHVLGQLRRSAKVEIRDPGASSRRGRRAPDVWLLDGHAGPPFDALAGTPVVAEVHEASWANPALRRYLDPAFGELMAARTQATMEVAAHVITLSRSARDEVVEAFGLDPARVHAVLLGVDQECFRPGLPGGRELVAAAGGGVHRPYVLFVGVVHPRKNLEAVRDALASLAQRGFGHVLAVVGGDPADRPDSRELQRAARAELPGAPGRIVFVEHPSEPELVALMAGADALCLPSFWEGFGLPALEAMACGTPVVVSDRGSLPEVVGDCGLVIEPTAAAVEQALASVLSEPGRAERLGAAGRARAEQLTWERTAAGWLEVLELAAEAGE